MLWYIPLLIFFARIFDVSINTVRTMLVIGGHRWIATFLGFFEVVIWVVAAGFAFKYLDNVWAVISYAGGFAAGVAVGMWLEERIALGYRMVQVIAPANGDETHKAISNALREHGFRVTRVEGTGRDGPVEVAYTIVRRRNLNTVRNVLKDIAPRAFIAIKRVEVVSNGPFSESPRFSIRQWERMGLVRK